MKQRRCDYCGRKTKDLRATCPTCKVTKQAHDLEQIRQLEIAARRVFRRQQRAPQQTREALT